MCLIDIEEKYKTTTLGGQRQEKEKKEEKRSKLARLDWDVNTSYRLTKLSSRLDWNINTAAPLTTTNNNDREDKRDNNT
jgi:hypothetical protein